jgi:hypothetical protein
MNKVSNVISLRIRCFLARQGQIKRVGSAYEVKILS